MRVTMVETACENNDERIDSDSDTIEIIVEKGMVLNFSILTDKFKLFGNAPTVKMFSFH
jgi:hypothetical protein